MSRYTTTFIILLLTFPLLLTAQTRQWQWAERGGGDGFNQNNENEEGVDIALDNNNDVYVCGHTFPLAMFSGTNLNFNLADLNIFLAKYHCEGGLAWVKGFGSSNRDRVNSIATDKENNVYITGEIRKGQSQNTILGDDTLTATGGFYVSKFDSAGNHVWNKIAFLNGSNGREIAIGPSSNLYIFGTGDNDTFNMFGHTLPPGAFIMKMSPEGDIHWMQPFRDDINDTGFSVNDMAVSKTTGDIYFAGFFNRLPYDTLVFHNAVIPRKSDNSDIIVSKFDSSGRFEWVRRAGSSKGLQRANDVSVAGDSAIYVAGQFVTIAQDADFGDITITKKIGMGTGAFLARYTSDGKVQWVEVPNDVTSNGRVSANATEHTFRGKVMLGGNYASGDLILGGHTYKNGKTSFFARYDTSGNFEEGFQPEDNGSIGSVGVNNLAAGYHNSMVFTGQFEERVVMNDLGDTINNTGGGEWDIITAKYGTGDCSVPDDTTGTSIKPTFGTTYKSITVSPNPVSGSHLQLQLSRSFEQDAAARIVSATGRTVWQGELPRGSSTIKPEQELPSGLYILELQTQEAKYTSKVLVSGSR